MRFNINEYDGRYCMHCRTREEAHIFLQYLHSVGKKWINGKSYLDTDEFEKNRSNTCYYFNQGQFGDLYYAKENNYNILEFDDFIWCDEHELDNELKIEKESVEILDAFLSAIKIN